MCKDNTITKLRRELVEAQSSAARWTGESVMMGAKAVELCDIIDALRLELAAAKAASELSTAERAATQPLLDALDDWVNAPDGNRRTDDSLIDAHQEYWKRVRALRAQKAEG